MRVAAAAAVLAGLAAGPAAVAAPAPSRGLGGGGLIAFRSCEPYGSSFDRSVVRVVRPDGSGMRVVRDFPPVLGPVECPYGKADWSWDGRRLLVGGPFLEIVTPRGRVLRTLQFPFDEPTWAPGRRGVTMVRAQSDRDSVWDYRFDGRLRRRVTRHWPNIGRHEWSPDGRTLAYERVGVVRPVVDIRLVDAGRRRDRLLVAGSLPRWSPDGRRLAYLRANDVWAVRRDGSDRRRLIDNGRDPAAGWHDWSPDGRWVVSGGIAPGGDPYDPRLQLVFARIDGRRERRLTLPAEIEGAYPLSWQPRR